MDTGLGVSADVFLSLQCFVNMKMAFWEAENGIKKKGPIVNKSHSPTSLTCNLSHTGRVLLVPGILRRKRIHYVGIFGLA